MQQTEHQAKKHLSFASLRSTLSTHFHSLPEHRQQAKVNYTLHDAFMSGFACMYFQDPSLLQFQQRLEDEQQMNNLHTLFNVHAIPQASQMREIIDEVASDHLRGLFKKFVSKLQRGKQLKRLMFVDNLYLIPIDGTQYFASEKTCCEQCLQRTHRDGKVSYSHQVLQASIVHPQCSQVIPLMPEEIRRQDGRTKQDCEINAAKRLLLKLREDYPKLGMVICGDGLYSHQPMIEEVHRHGMHYIFTAKPDDHTYMMEWLEAYPRLERYEHVDDKGRTHVYEWMNQVPLSGRADALNVNYFRYQLIRTDQAGSQKVTYKSSWVTDLAITKETIARLVSGARSRWKCENEIFNTLKNQGYYIEHNYGHGQQHLCFNFYLLTLLAFSFHQIFELSDGAYQACRKKFGSKRHMWETLRVYITIIVYASWSELLSFALTPTQFSLQTIGQPP